MQFSQIWFQSLPFHNISLITHHKKGDPIYWGISNYWGFVLSSDLFANLPVYGLILYFHCYCLSLFSSLTICLCFSTLVNTSRRNIVFNALFPWFMEWILIIDIATVDYPQCQIFMFSSHYFELVCLFLSNRNTA